MEEYTSKSYRGASRKGNLLERMPKRDLVKRIRATTFALYDIVDDIRNGRTEWETNGTLDMAIKVLEEPY